MPEIDFMLFDLSYLWKLFPKCENDIERNVLDYEEDAKVCMAQIRLNLFSETANSEKAYV